MAGPGAGMPVHRTMRGLPDEAGRGARSCARGTEHRGTGRTDARGSQDRRGVAASSSGR